MLKISYDEIVRIICEEKGLSKSEVDVKVSEKTKQLGDLVSKEGAAHIVASQLGVKVFQNVAGKEIKVKEIFPGMSIINTNARITNLFGIREFDTGQRKGRVATLVIGDETGIIRLVIWDERLIKFVEDGKIRENDIIKIKSGYARDNNGYKELHLGAKSDIIVSPAGVFIGDITRQSSVSYSRKKISELNENDNAELYGTIVQVFEPRFYDACPSCGKKLVDNRCSEHGNVVATTLPVLNVFFDDGFGNIRVVFFRDIVEKILGLGKNEVIGLNENPERLEVIRNSLLGKQLVIVGRTTKNQMFDRLEFTARDIKEVSAEEILKDMQK